MPKGTVPLAQLQLSSLQIGADGGLRLLEPIAGGAPSAGASPLDLAVAPDGGFRYEVKPGISKNGRWRIKDDGRLARLGTIGGLEPAPATEPSAYFTHTGRSAAGIAAY